MKEEKDLVLRGLKLTCTASWQALCREAPQNQNVASSLPVGRRERNLVNSCSERNKQVWWQILLSGLQKNGNYYKVV